LVNVTAGDLVSLLSSWLPRQRWFAGKGRPGMRLRVCSDVALSDLLRHLLVEASYSDGGRPDLYQVPLVVRPDAPYGHEGFLLGESPGGLVYDGLHDPDGSAALLRFLTAGERRGGLAAHRLAPVAALPAHAVGVEQSNTSIVYGEDYILKVFRRLWPGTNPDLEVTLALADAGSAHIARPLAWLDGTVEGAPTTLALMQEYLRSGTEGWRLALASVRDLFAEADLHADEVGGDFAAEAERLGAATAEVHRSLARALPTLPPPADAYRVQAARLHARLDAALAGVGALGPFEAGVRAAFDALAAAPVPPVFQRIHGDLHLGQVLRVDSGWVLFDFEGEPARPVEERNTCESPLRDVAGMLRSFDYASRSLLLERVDDEPALAYRAQEWADRNRDAFCRGYAAVSGRDPRADAAVLRALELDKAVYEVLYEARHRPSWIRIPLGSLEHMSQPDERAGAASAPPLP
jgi:maltokinase